MDTLIILLGCALIFVACVLYLRKLIIDTVREYIDDARAYRKQARQLARDHKISSQEVGIPDHPNCRVYPTISVGFVSLTDQDREELRQRYDRPSQIVAPIALTAEDRAWFNGLFSQD